MNAFATSVAVRFLPAIPARARAARRGPRLDWCPAKAHAQLFRISIALFVLAASGILVPRTSAAAEAPVPELIVYGQSTSRSGISLDFWFDGLAQDVPYVVASNHVGALCVEAFDSAGTRIMPNACQGRVVSQTHLPRSGRFTIRVASITIPLSLVSPSSDSYM